MPFAVVPADGMTTDEEYTDYFDDLVPGFLKQRVDFAEVVAFARKLRGKKDRWLVREVGDPSIGPLRPIEIRFGGPRFGVALDLAPWINLTLRDRFPGSCQNRTVCVSSSVDAVQGPILDDYRRHARPILTGMELGQLEMFKPFIVTDSVSKACVIPSTPRPIVARELAEVAS